MKSFRQLLRQPVKLVAGLILMTVAAAILCVCVGQALAAWNTARELDEQFTTVAMPREMGGLDENGYLLSEVAIPEDVTAWLRELEASDRGVIKALQEHGFLSASIPELTPLNYTQGELIQEERSDGTHAYYRYDPETDGRPYSSAMLVITLEAVSEPKELISDQFAAVELTGSELDFGSKRLFDQYVEKLGERAVTAGYTVTLSGTITQVVSLQEGFRDPTGMTARLDITLPTAEALEALELEVGQTYLVYGMNYFDEDWAFRGYLENEGHIKGAVHIDEFDLRNLHYYTEKELKRLNQPDSGIIARYTVTQLIEMPDGSIAGQTKIVNMTQRDCDKILSISMSLSADLRYNRCLDWFSTYLHSPYVDLRPDVTYTDNDGQTVTMSWEEYGERYEIPTFVKLEGSVEDFLRSEEGKPWQEALERDEVNHHAFAVLGVEKADHLTWFTQEEAKITQGRDITGEEYKNGTRVCILHEGVAAESGLKVGDTVTLNLYRGDNGLPYQGLLGSRGTRDVLIPSADFYFDTTPILETAEFTIVGLWSGPETWPDIGMNPYALSPNTVIVPESAVSASWEHPQSVLYTTIILENGAIEQFRELVQEADLSISFSCFDQGFTELAGNFHNYGDLSRQMLTVGAVVYGVILLLFLLLFPGTQRRAVGTMQSLGMPFGKRFGHVMLTVAGVVVPAAVLGGGAGMLLWQRVLDALQASAESKLALQLDGRILLLIALGQLVFAMVLSAVVAALVAAPKGMARRGK